RRARDDDVPEIEQRGERGRVAAAQALVQGEWRVDEWGLEPLRQVRLEDVARADVLDDAGNGVEVARAREIGADAGDVGDRIGRGRAGGGSLRDQTTQALREPPPVRPDGHPP